jgi:glutamate synthase (NADPH/NADH) small chain
MSTNLNKVFAAGDAASGASLVVNAIASGRRVAKNIDEFLASK